MTQHVACAWVPSPEHMAPNHPEHPRRLQRLLPLREGATDLPLAWLAVAPAPRERLTSVHPPAYLDALAAACAQGPAVIDYAPTFVTPASFQAALAAAGGTLACLDALLTGAFRRAFALVRPPGHHAEPERAMGFCLLNNTAIAAVEALRQGLRVLVLDLDAHHGNGIQAVAWDREDMAYFSIHQEGIYPGTGSLTAAPHARGRIVNLPVPAGADDCAYLLLWEQVLAPLATRFAPDLLMVALGFDAHWRDPLTDLGLSAQGYGLLLREVVHFALSYTQGRVLCVLEGGYDPVALAASVLSVLHALAEAPLPADPLGQAPTPGPDVQPLVSRAQDLHGV